MNRGGTPLIDSRTCDKKARSARSHGQTNLFWISDGGEPPSCIELSTVVHRVSPAVFVGPPPVAMSLALSVVQQVLAANPSVSGGESADSTADCDNESGSADSDSPPANIESSARDLPAPNSPRSVEPCATLGPAAVTTLNRPSLAWYSPRKNESATFDMSFSTDLPLLAVAGTKDAAFSAACSASTRRSCARLDCSRSERCTCTRTTHARGEPVDGRCHVCRACPLATLVAASSSVACGG